MKPKSYFLNNKWFQKSVEKLKQGHKKYIASNKVSSAQELHGNTHMETKNYLIIKK